VFMLFILVFTQNIVYAAPARSNCTSVEQEAIDFKTLEKKIRKTKAIGVMTKLKLSSDINKLLKELNAFHAGNSSLTLEQQREQYDLLYMKIVTLVQKKDPELFHQLCNVWDPLWVALQDEENLKKVSQVRMIEIMATAQIAKVLMSIIATVIPSANAEENFSHDEVVKKDLFIVITLHGVHCKAVVGYEQIADQHYVAICESGDRYRLHVSEEGRVSMAPHHSN